jgi:aminoglycoside phosphotransferase (APT) family kinase protein
VRFEAPSPEAIADRLRTVFEAHHLDVTVESVARVHKGMSSLTYTAQLRFSGIGVNAIVKAATPGTIPRGNRDVLRQTRIMQALEDTRVPVPVVLGQDEGSPPDAPPLFVMTRVDGDAVDPAWPLDPELPDDTVVARTLAMARTLADLHSVPLRGLLPNEPSLSLTDEVDRWSAVYATLDLDLDAVAARCESLLRRTVPRPLLPVLNHGDYRFGNVVFEDCEVRAVIDWEIAAKQDARFDLANLALYHGPDSPLRLRTSAASVPPGRIVEEYEARAGVALRDLSWFDAALRFKCAAALGLLVKNSRKRGEHSAELERVATRLRGFLQAALA